VSVSHDQPDIPTPVTQSPRNAGASQSPHSKTPPTGVSGGDKKNHSTQLAASTTK